MAGLFGDSLHVRSNEKGQDEKWEIQGGRYPLDARRERPNKASER